MRCLVRGLAVVMLLAVGWAARGLLSLARASAAPASGLPAQFSPVVNTDQLAELLGQGKTLFYRPGPSGPWVPFTVGDRYVGPEFVWLSSGQAVHADG